MAKRYFNEETKVKPGLVSDQLRNALGISKKSLPIWIYRMRILGYPPGWLKKADMTNTTIDFINGDEDIEEGQLSSIEKKVSYNTDSFHEFPGFNSPVPPGMKDDYERLGMPPMQAFQQLNYAKQTVQALQPVPHRRFTDVKNKNEEEESSDEDASDTEKKPDDQSTSVPDSSVEVLNTAVINLSSDAEDKDDDQSSTDTDEIITLDIEKRVLCSKTAKKEAIEVVEKSTVKEPKTTSEESEFSKDNSSKSDPNETTDLSTETQDEARTQSDQKHQDSETVEIDADQDDRNKNFDFVEEEESNKILISEGVPVPASLNGEKPPLENFAVGMGELIYFENLPTSTGVFNRMRKVIKKVRKKLSSPSTKLDISSTTTSSQPDQDTK